MNASPEGTVPLNWYTFYGGDCSENHSEDGNLKGERLLGVKRLDNGGIRFTRGMDSGGCAHNKKKRVVRGFGGRWRQCGGRLVGQGG